MAQYTIDIAVNSKSVNELETDLQALEAQFKQLKIGDPGFNELGNKIKGVRSQLKDVELQFEGLDKEQRATALVDTFTGLVGAVGAVSSAFIAFGADAEAIEDAEKKLLGIVGVVSGLRDASNGLLAAQKVLGPSFIATGASIKAAFTTATGGVNTFKVALASVGIGLAIAALAKLYDLYEESAAAAAEAAKQAAILNNIEEESVTIREEEIKQIIPLLTAAKQENISRQDRVKAIQAIQAEYPDYLKNQDLDTVSIKTIESANESLILSIGKRAKAQAALTELGKNYAKQIEIELKLSNLQVDVQKRTNELSATLSPDQVKKSLEVEQNLSKLASTTLNQELEKLKLQQQRIDNYINENDLVGELTSNIKTQGKTVEKNAKDAVKMVEDGLNLLAPLTQEAADKAAEAAKAALDKRVQAELGAAEAARQVRLAQAASESAAIQIDYENKLAALQESYIQEQIAAAGNAEALAAIDIKYADLSIAADAEVQKKFEELDQKTSDQQIQLAADTADKIKVINDKAAEDKAAAIQKQVAITDALIADASRLTEALGTFANARATNEKNAIQDQIDSQVKLAEATGANKEAIEKITTEGQAKLDEAGKKAFEKQKQFAVASAVLDGGSAVLRIFGNAAANPKSILFPAQPYIEAAIAAVFTASKIKQIKSTSYGGGGGGGGGGGSAPSIGGAGGSIPTTTGTFIPTLPQGTTTPTSQSSTTPVFKAYVVSSDVTDAQQAEAQINQKRKF